MRIKYAYYGGVVALIYVLYLFFWGTGGHYFFSMTLACALSFGACMLALCGVVTPK